MQRSVLIVEDDVEISEMYADAIRRRGLPVHCIEETDEVLRYLKGGGPADVIVWDMMMPPGAAFGVTDTGGGISTGEFLFEEMRHLRPNAIFVLLTIQTQVSPVYDSPATRSYVRTKMHTSPAELASFLLSLLVDGDDESNRDESKEGFGA